MAATYCMAEGCDRAPAVREKYQGKDGEIIDEVCSHHTGRLDPRLPMLSTEALPGQVAYKIGAGS